GSARASRAGPSTRAGHAAGAIALLAGGGGTGRHRHAGRTEGARRARRRRSRGPADSRSEGVAGTSRSEDDLSSLRRERNRDRGRSDVPEGSRPLLGSVRRPFGGRQPGPRPGGGGARSPQDFTIHT